MALRGWGHFGIVLRHVRNGTPETGTVPVGDLLVGMVANGACYMGSLTRVEGCVSSHLVCCLFA